MWPRLTPRGCLLSVHILDLLFSVIGVAQRLRATRLLAAALTLALPTGVHSHKNRDLSSSASPRPLPHSLQG